MPNSAATATSAEEYLSCWRGSLEQHLRKAVGKALAEQPKDPCAAVALELLHGTSLEARVAALSAAQAEQEDGPQDDVAGHAQVGCTAGRVVIVARELGMQREQATLLIETLGIVIALTLATVCTASQWISFSDLMSCGLFEPFWLDLAFCFQFCLGQLIVFVCKLIAIGYVYPTGNAWILFQPILMLSFVADVTIFVIIHVKLANMLQNHMECQRTLLVMELSGDDGDLDMLQLAQSAVIHMFNQGHSFGPLAWFAYMLPLSVVTLLSAFACNACSKKSSTVVG